MQRCFRCLADIIDRAPACPQCHTRVLSPMQIGQILVEEGSITQTQLDDGLAVQRATGRRLGNILTEKGYVSDRDFAESLARQLEMPFFDLEGYMIDPVVVALIPEHLCERYRLIPLMKTGEKLLVAFADPQNSDALADLKLATQLVIKPAVATTDDVNRALACAFDSLAIKGKMVQSIWGVRPRKSTAQARERRASGREPSHAIAAKSGAYHLRRIR